MTLNPNSSSVQQALIGVWDVYASGIQSQVVFHADGTYTNTLLGGMQRHWGQWAVLDNFGSYGIRFQLKGAEPKSFIGPLGSMPIVWPEWETWVITDIQQNQIQIYGGTMFRQQALPSMPGFPSYPTNVPPQPAPSISTEAENALREATQGWVKTMQEMNETTKAAYDKANKAWSDYLKS